jgi:uncharacterized protein YceH (UPF0502 family)
LDTIMSKLSDLENRVSILETHVTEDMDQKINDWEAEEAADEMMVTESGDNVEEQQEQTDIKNVISNDIHNKIDQLLTAFTKLDARILTLEKPAENRNTFGSALSSNH